MNFSNNQPSAKPITVVIFPFKVMLVVEVTSNRETGVTSPISAIATAPDPAFNINSNSPLVAPPSVIELSLLVTEVLATKVTGPLKFVIPEVTIAPPKDELPITSNSLLTFSAIPAAIIKDEIG